LILAKNQVSSSVIKRLPRYYRFLEELKNQNITRISSQELAELMGFTASQIRQDLNCFGGFGQQGYGYNVSQLHMEIAKILGINKLQKTIIIGAGNLGKAVASHIEFEKKGCQLIGIFDNNPELCGQTIAGHKVLDISQLEKFCYKNNPVAAVLCIPKSVGKDISERLINLGIYAFWNFSHYDIKTGKHKNIIVENVHLADSLMILSYKINNKEQS
jgi:redox-sensing transcriptional repressor